MTAVPGARLRVDPVACEGVGLCARIAPALVSLDRWGYPRVVEHPLGAADVRAADRATRACPFAALWVQAPEPPPPPRPAPRADPEVSAEPPPGGRGRAGSG